MYQVRLICAIRMRSGIPPGCVVNIPNKGPQIMLPEPIVNLGKTSESVTFNMYCSDITIIKNSVPSGWGSKGSWKWFSQPPGKPWYVKIQTNLLNSELDRSLNTPYFNAHPVERDALRLRLDNISDSAFSLQQLLFNLDNAIAQSVPTFFGVTDETASYLLGKSFINIWSKIAKQYGLPLIGVTAVAQHPDGSPLRLTALERWVSPVVDFSSGEQVKNPSHLEIAATTLNYLCATDGHRLPGPSSFNWNWIEPQDLAQSSGIISIKRDTMARYLVDQILPQVRSSCIKPNVNVTAENELGKVKYEWDFSPGQEPHTVEIPSSGPLVAKLDYSFSVRADDRYALTYGELKISSTYSCAIVFGNYDRTKNPPVYIGGNTFTVVQGLWIWVFVQWAASKADAYVVNQIRSDEFVISVDENGGLTSSATNNSTMTDSAKDIEIGFADKFLGLQTRLRNIKNTISALPNARLQSLPFNSIKNFVFPGAKVFSYKDASFSNHSDLACRITYVSPTEDPWKIMTPGPSHRTDDPPETIYLDEVPSLAAFVLQLRAGELKRLEEEHMAEKPPLPIEDSTVMNADRLGISVAQNGDKNSNVEGMSTTLKHSPLAEKFKSKRHQERAVITSSTELMLNYVQGELVNPEGEFRALQTANGTALLFAIDSSGSFNVFEETVAETRTGWRATNLSTKIINEKFSSGAKALHFDVGQSVMNNHTISLAMAVRSNGSDNLFLSLNNSPSSTSQWISNPDWTSFPFDAQNRPSSIQITGIYISETDQQQQYIMVDILRNPNSDLKATSRYIVDPFSTGVHWMPHTLPFEVEQGTYQSCVGRVPGAFVDGIYTAGSVKGAAQMSYVPLFNSPGSAAPMPTRLPLPNKALATAIASARYPDGTTDFYAVSDSTLYRWSSNQQLRDNTVGTALLTNPVFTGTDTLIALIHDGITTIFGKDSSDAVYYTSCQINHLADPMLWSAPVPVLHGIERITSFINLKDGGNTVFAAGANRIDKLTQATNTESKLWRAQSIMLEASPQSKPMSFTSYTTTIIVKGPDGHRLTEGEILLSTAARTPVYIDGIYYILSTTPVTVPVGISGQVMVIQATDSIVGSTISVRLGEADHVVNPMAISFDKLTKLSTKDALKNAQIRTNTVAGGVTGSSEHETIDGHLQSKPSSGKSVFTRHETYIFYPEAIDPNPKNPRRIPTAVLGAAGAVTLVATDFLFATIPLENSFISTLRKVTGLVTVLFKCVFSSPAQKFFDKYQFLNVLTAADPRKIGAIFDMVVAAPAFFCIFYHFQELSEKPASRDRTLAIMEETSRMMAVFARVSYTVAVNAPDPVDKVVAASSMSACHVVTAALEFTCSAMMWD